MGEFAEIQEAIEQRFENEIASVYSIPTLYDNAFPPDIADSDLYNNCWCRVAVNPGETDQHEIGGGAGHETFMHYGILTISIFTKLKRGTEAANDIADLIISAFRNKTADGVHYETPSRSNAGRTKEGDWWLINVDIPFYSFVSG